MASTEELNVLVFAGQGTTAINSPDTRQQALRDAEHPLCAVLLSSCYKAFISELSSLPPTDYDDIDLKLADFPSLYSLLELTGDKYLYNPIITGPTLFLVQALRYLAHIEGLEAEPETVAPFSDILTCNRKYAVGLLGFSSGILPACVIASSTTPLDYVSRAIEAYRLTLWIGIRTQLYRKKALFLHSHITEPSLPWSLVFFGLTREAAEDALASFNKGSHFTPLYITAIMDDTSVTISGHPSALATFAGTLGPGVVVHKTTVDTLYHAPVHAEGVRKQVLDDVERRKISFPKFADIHTPVRSTFTGELITKDSSGTLIEVIVDLVLSQPVHWHLVTERTLESLPEGVQVRLLNVGPGTGLARSLERAFNRLPVVLTDLASPTKSGATKTKAPKQEPIAIVGMAVHMPGAMNVDQLWEVLEKGINTISEIPEHRFKVSDYKDAKDSKSKRTMKAHTGNFVDGVDEFDNQFFRISPREAKSMDPQQRLLLHAAYEALEDAGYVPNSSSSSTPDRFGCYIGVATHDYVHNLRDDIDVYYSTGTLASFLSGRLSYAMQMSGPSIVLDTACSGSLVAVYQGARALMNRDCDAAMVGGVNVISSPDMFLGLDRGHFLSPTGQCKPWDSSADGYSRSEGCGIFVLKRLSDAIKDHDHIWGVIRGIEVNHSGLAHSITHPHPPTQAILFEQLLENSGIDPQRINVIEAHGTGTQAGDPSEIESIRKGFAKRREASNPLYVSSIKANVGHMEAASGSAGLAKLLLMLRYGKIPSTISLKNLNPRVTNLESDSIIIPTSHAAWHPSRQGENRLAVLNNFGASGSNAALILEEFARNVDNDGPDTSFIFGLSAKSQTAAETLRDKYVKWLSMDQINAKRLADIAYTATARRQLYDYRLAVTASSKEDLIKKLESAKVVRTEARDAKIVFVFSGQGSQYLGMGSSLYATSPLFKRHIDECHATLVSAGFSGILPIIAPSTDGPSTVDGQGIEAFQSALFSVDYALAKLWMSWGIKPAAVVGHSLGEYAAMVISGVLSLQGALTLIANRARLMVQKCEIKTTGMIAINLGSDNVASALASSSDFSSLTIACYNSPTDCVVSGPLERLEAFKKYLDSQLQCKNIILSVPFGYHSTAMSPLVDALTSIAKDVAIRAPSIPIISNLHGNVVMPGDRSVYNAEYFSRHATEPVLFESGISQLTTVSDVDAWIEIGPHTTTLPMLRSNASLAPNALFLASINKRHDAWVTLNASLSSMYTSGIRLLWREVFSHVQSVACISGLPSYPFTKSKFWVSYKEPQVTFQTSQHALEPPKSSGYTMLHSFTQYPSDNNNYTAIFETPISQLGSFIAGHCVGEMALCPASVYIEQVFAGLELIKKHLGIDATGNQPILRDIEFSKPLVYHETVKRTVVTTINFNETSGDFAVSSRVGGSEESIHCKGQYRFQPSARTLSKFARQLPVIERRIAAIIRPQTGKQPEMFSTRTVYEVIFPRVVKYSKEYQTMKSLCVSADGLEGCAKVSLTAEHGQGVFSAHPVFVDTLLHAAGFVANMSGGPNDAYICSEVGSVKVFPEFIKQDTSYTVYCNNVWLPEQNVIVAEAYAVTTPARKVVAYLKGMHFRRMRLRSFMTILNAAVDGNARHGATAKSVNLSLVADKLRDPKLNTQGKPSVVAVPDVISTVITVVAEACSVDRSEVKAGSDLTAIGVDSMMSIEIAHKLQEVFPDTNVDASTFSHCQTIQQIADEVNSRCDSGSGKTSNTATAVTPSSSHPSSPRTLVQDQPLPSCASEEELNVKAIISSVLDISIHEVEDNQDLESLGLDSLTSIEALHVLKEKSSLELPDDLFHSCKTTRALQEYFASQSRAARKSAELTPAKKAISLDAKAVLRLDNIPSLLHEPTPPTNRPPLFLIHDGSGLTNYYERLPRLDRPVWVINNPHFETAEPWESVSQMAIDYADRLQRLGQQQVVLGGESVWSV
ncbi:hypothetical protein M378DRAFT_133566 [Amanita muscaria Koide BX008]|uniref:Polyketide synthase n=1 Tax=Amanita muscaria (strain Koide BX008) TaxID=946122 RepID=A0A0C2W7B0_AMAMK|nr:hypothetical protein M378DRAFT_133566 [Amanita muscaria Koide BX008]